MFISGGVCERVGGVVECVSVVSAGFVPRRAPHQVQRSLVKSGSCVDVKERQNGGMG